MKTAILPTGTRLLIRADSVGEKKVGKEKLVYVPDKHSELSRTATIMAMGEAVNWHNPQEIGKPQVDLKINDRVLIHFTAGTCIDSLEETMATDDTIRLIERWEVLAVLKPEN